MIIYNDDSDSLRRIDPPHGEEQIDVPIRHLADTPVKIFCWGLDGGDIAYSWPSKVIENYYDRIGDAPDPRNVMLSLHRKGIDYLPTLIQRTRRLGIRFFGSFRMNDCHHRSEPRGILSSRFWQEHQHLRLWDVTAARTYYNASLDYTHVEVRQRRFEAIREMIERYDIDGIELDFCRNPYLFPKTHAWERRGLLTELLRRIRAALRAVGEQRGKRLELLVRVPFDERLRMDAGIDVETWLNDGMIDLLAMSCLFNDYNQSVEPWLTRCRQHGVGFFPSVEAVPAHNAAHNHVTRQSVNDIILRHRAAAQNFLGQGAAGIYTYNFPCHLFETLRSADEKARLTQVLRQSADASSLSGHAKQYTFWRDLPIQLESHRPAEHHQTLRFCLFDSDLLKPDTQVQMSFHQAIEPNPHVDAPPTGKPPETLPPGWVTYWLNGQPVPEAWIQRMPQPAGRIVSGFTLGVHETIILTPPASAMRVGENTLGFLIPRFPEEHDPYINIYELLVNVRPSALNQSG
ncbi:MAG: hypothetical protein IT446_03075 [Phycisphaerales bacterium]|nr:hypothetical protein [Phycisphaerales bacterium]